MKVWITSVLVLLGMIETYQWMRHFTLPLPMFILGGALLAIASNYGKFAGYFFQKQQTQSDANQVQTLPVSGFATNAANWTNLKQSSATPVAITRPISFTIRPHAGEDARNDNF
jgi:hypothetical protein